MYETIDYDTLDGKQKECYNFQIVSARFAKCGYLTVKLSNDWNGADFLAIKFGDKYETMRVQLKARFSIDKSRYYGKDLWIAFPSQGEWYCVEHDALFNQSVVALDLNTKKSFCDGDWSSQNVPHKLKKWLENYKLPT